MEYSKTLRDGLRPGALLAGVVPMLVVLMVAEQLAGHGGQFGAAAGEQATRSRTEPHEAALAS
jgi:hypothetical protein